MADPSAPTVTQQHAQAAPAKKSGCGKCCLVGCLGLVLLVVGSGIAAWIGIPWYGRSLRDGYTDIGPMAVPVVEATPQELGQIRRRVEAFAQTVEDPAVSGTLVLTAADINRLLSQAKDRNPQQSKASPYMEIADGKVTGRVSVALDDTASDAESMEFLEKVGLKGRYLNLSVTFKVSLRDRALAIHIDDIKARGKSLPWILSPFVSVLRKENLAAKMIEQNPNMAKSLSKIESVEVKDDKIIIKSKGGGTPAPASPAEARPAPNVRGR